MSETLRYCPTGNHFTTRNRFRRVAERMVRDCMSCEEAKAKRRKTSYEGRIIERPYEPGLDMDAIYRVPRFRHLWPKRFPT